MMLHTQNNFLEQDLVKTSNTLKTEQILNHDLKPKYHMSRVTERERGREREREKRERERMCVCVLGGACMNACVCMFSDYCSIQICCILN